MKTKLCLIGIACHTREVTLAVRSAPDGNSVRPQVCSRFSCHRRTRCNSQRTGGCGCSGWSTCSCCCSHASHCYAPGHVRRDVECHSAVRVLWAAVQKLGPSRAYRGGNRVHGPLRQAYLQPACRFAGICRFCLIRFLVLLSFL